MRRSLSFALVGLPFAVHGQPTPPRITCSGIRIQPDSIRVVTGKLENVYIWQGVEGAPEWAPRRWRFVSSLPVDGSEAILQLAGVICIGRQVEQILALLPGAPPQWVSIAPRNFSQLTSMGHRVHVKLDGTWVPAHLPIVPDSGTYRVLDSAGTANINAMIQQARLAQYEREAEAEQLEQARRAAQARAAAERRQVERREEYLRRGWSEAEVTRILNREIWIGMTEAQLRASWGAPREINTTITAYGSRAQWVYSRDYVYVEGGRVITIQTSR